MQQNALDKTLLQAINDVSLHLIKTNYISSSSSSAQKIVGLFEGGLRGETAESARCSRSAALESHDCKRRPCLKREKLGAEEDISGSSLTCISF